MPATQGKFKVKSRTTASILLNIHGVGQVNKKNFISGTVLFIPANDAVEIENISKDLLLFQAVANV